MPLVARHRSPQRVRESERFRQPMRDLADDCQRALLCFRLGLARPEFGFEPSREASGLAGIAVDAYLRYPGGAAILFLRRSSGAM